MQTRYLVGAGVGVLLALLYYCAKPVSKLTFYDPEVIRPGGPTVSDPPTVISGADIDAQIAEALKE
jgi:hypothetical protein